MKIQFKKITRYALNLVDYMDYNSKHYNVFKIKYKKQLIKII